MQVVCSECGAKETLTSERWRCACGGPWEPAERTDFDPALIDAADMGVWRYRKLYGLDFDAPTVRLAAGATPLVPVNLQQREVLFKLDFLGPTGSFKDRCTEVMINILAHQGVTRVCTSSSGNAGASLAAYAAKAGIRADVCVPVYASPSKVAQIAIFGARVHRIPGPRANATLAAQEAAKRETVLVAHGSHPGFLLGQQSAAWELWEQLGHRPPDWFVAPFASGSNILGVWLGFRRLRAAGLVDRLPRLVAAQAARIAPLYRAFEAGLETVPAVESEGPTIAEGATISKPHRGRRALEAIRETGGTCVAVEEEAILPAQSRLAHHGLYVEPTSALAVAALEAVFKRAAPDETIVVSLTGSGLKGSPTL